MFFYSGSYHSSNGKEQVLLFASKYLYCHHLVGEKTKPCNIEPTKALTKNNSMTIMFVSLHELNLLNTKNIFQLKNNLRNSEKKNSRNVVKMLNLNSHIQKVSGYYVAMKSIKVKFKILLHFQAIESNLIVI